MIQTHTVIFMDVLGFAQQVVKDDGALGLLDSFYNSSHSFNELLHRFTQPPPTAPIERLFALFHVGVEEEIGEALKASHLHSIVFSDSAFIAFEHPIDGLVFCQRVMRKMIRGGVPIRMGVAQGSFKPLRFKTDLARDITLHSSYFLGSGVVKAHAAESSGVSGLRILLHKDFPIPGGFEEEEFIPLTPPAETSAARLTKFAKGAAVADRELAYLTRHIKEWALPDDHYVNEDIDKKNEELVAQVKRMRDQSEAAVHYHYDDTLKAIEQMPVDLKRPPRQGST
jgi:hypothetical protein